MTNDNIQVLNKEMEATNKKIKSFKDLKLVSRFMLLVQPIIFTFDLMIGHIIDKTQAGMAMTVSSALKVCIPASILFIISGIVAQKLVNKYNEKYEEKKELKKQYQHELNLEKEKQLEKENNITTTHSFSQYNQVDNNLNNNLTLKLKK